MIVEVSDRLYWVFLIALLCYSSDLVLTVIFTLHEREVALREILFPSEHEEEPKCQVV